MLHGSISEDTLFSTLSSPLWLFWLLFAWWTVCIKPGRERERVTKTITFDTRFWIAFEAEKFKADSDDQSWLCRCIKAPCGLCLANVVKSPTSVHQLQFWHSRIGVILHPTTSSLLVQVRLKFVFTYHFSCSLFLLVSLKISICVPLIAYVTFFICKLWRFMKPTYN